MSGIQTESGCLGRSLFYPVAVILKPACAIEVSFPTTNAGQLVFQHFDLKGFQHIAVESHG